MSSLLFAVVAAYFALLLLVAWRTSRAADNDSFFIGNRRSHWLLVAFGMIGTSLSGVTFVSVPGTVGSQGFGYFQVVLGQWFGYLAIALLLLQLYYRLGLTSIYGYLGQRFGPASHRVGAGFFILSRTLGATARLYLVVRILQEWVLDSLHLPFWLTLGALLLMILIYTYEGGVRTIVWTDTLQTACMLGGLVLCVFFLLGEMQLDMGTAWQQARNSGLTALFSAEMDSRHFAGKELLAGVCIALAMTGLDQEMMQKSLSVTTLGASQKNILVMSCVMLAVVLLFLFLGALLHLFAESRALAASGDRLFPAVVFEALPDWMHIVFIIALISALFPSADGAMTALTASVCVDLLAMEQRTDWDEARRKRIRHGVHLGFAALFLLLVMAFHWANNPSMVGLILKLAGYTYGPLLGLFAFGLFSRRQPRDRWVPAVALSAPALCFLLDQHQQALFGGYQIGLELLLVNALLTYAGLWLISHEKNSASAAVGGSTA